MFRIGSQSGWTSIHNESEKQRFGLQQKKKDLVGKKRKKKTFVLQFELPKMGTDRQTKKQKKKIQTNKLKSTI